MLYPTDNMDITHLCLVRVASMPRNRYVLLCLSTFETSPPLLADIYVLDT